MENSKKWEKGENIQCSEPIQIQTNCCQRRFYISGEPLYSGGVTKQTAFCDKKLHILNTGHIGQTCDNFFFVFKRTGETCDWFRIFFFLCLQKVDPTSASNARVTCWDRGMLGVCVWLDGRTHSNRCYLVSCAAAAAGGAAVAAGFGARTGAGNLVD